LKKCQICDQKADLYTSVHKKEPFADGRLYDLVCFTCYFVPKTVDQKYTPEGYVAEDLELPYSCENLHTPKELHGAGTSDSAKHAGVCVEAVRSICQKALKSKDPRKRPKALWNSG
jgi:hypothetical protein